MALLIGMERRVPEAQQCVIVTPATLAGVTTVVITLAVSAAMLLFRALPAGINMRDFVATLDGAYRISRGLTPHVDFAVPHGTFPLYQALPAFYFQNVVSPFALYQLVGWFAVIPAALRVAMLQRNALQAVVVIAFAATATLAPYLVDDDSSGFGYYAAYNRLSTALLFLTLMWVLAPKRPSWPDVALITYVFLLLLATKITTFAAALIILAVYGCTTPVIRPVLLRSLLSLAALVAALQAITGMPMAYARDIKAMADVNRGGSAHRALTTSLHYLAPVAAAGALLLAVLPPWRHRPSCAILTALIRRPWTFLRFFRSAILIVTVLTLAILVESQNTGSIGLAVLVAFPVSSLPLRRVSLRLGIAASVALAVAAVSPWMTVVVYRTLSVVGKQLPESVEEPALSRLLPYTVAEAKASNIATDYLHIWTAAANPSTGFALGASWLDAGAANDIGLFLAQARLIDEALAVANARGIAPPSSHVITVGDVDYMGYLLHATPVKGVALWHNTRTFKGPSVEQVRHYLRLVEVAFEPRCGLSTDDLYIVGVFVPALQIDFRREQLTECWYVWLRAQ